MFGWMFHPKQLCNKRVFEKAKQSYLDEFRARMILMSYKPDKDMIEELNQTIKKKDPKEPIEKTLITFCAKTGISMDTCKVYYKQLEKKGKIKEK
jgi:intergrase/recombinase